MALFEESTRKTGETQAPGSPGLAGHSHGGAVVPGSKAAESSRFPEAVRRLLEESQATFNLFLEAAPDAMVVVDMLGRIALVNRRVEQLFGFLREEIVGQTIDRLLPGFHQNLPLESWVQDPVSTMAPPLGSGRVMPGVKKDGTEVPIEISLGRLPLGEITMIIGILRDTSQREHAEAKFRGLLESAPDGIVVADARGKIVMVNTQAEQLFGYRRDELVGQPVEILVPDQFKRSHVKDRENYTHAPRTRPMGGGRPLSGRKKDGTEFPVEISLSPLQTEQGTLITSIVRDITERRQAEEQIKGSLREKEVLLKEIHHRVKNNLQVTSSLLKLQSGYIQDPQAREMFGESQNRIRSMALVHEKLYQSSDLSRINFCEYVDTLAALLFRSYGADANQIRLTMQNQPAYLSVETAVPCGLIVNELLSNCLKHAFPNGRKGEIRITIIQGAPESLSLSVADNGVGLPKNLDLDLEKTETLGLQLVRTLTRQLSGRLEIRHGPWMEFHLHFTSNKI